MNPINNHINSSLVASRIHKSHAAEMTRSLEKLASGKRINRGADDPAGLITSENLRAVLAAMDAEVRSLQRTDHVANTAEGALHEISNLLNDAESFVAAYANSAAMSDEEREANQMQLDSTIESINRIANSTMFNGRRLFDGATTLSANGEVIHLDQIDAHHLGEVEAEDDGATYSLYDLRAGRPLNILSGDLSEAQETIHAAREQINSLRGRLGAFQAYTVRTRLNELSVSMENIASAESQIRDTDYARESANFARVKLLHDISIRNLGVINSNPSSVLNLLG